MTFKQFSIFLFTVVVSSVAVIIGSSQDANAQTTTPTQTPDLPESTVDHRFGVVESFWEAEEAAELEVGWDRILFYWNEIQPTGPDDWNTLHVLEEWLDDAREHDRLVMGLLKNTPGWATDAEPYSGVPRGLYLPVDDPGNLWAGYVAKVVKYYAPLGVHHWIIWNEPEIEAGVYGHEFSGSTRDYYQLLKVAYQVAKANDPEAVIHLAGWSYWHDPSWLGQFLQIAVADPEAKDHNYFFDIITLHIYFRVETVEELVNETWDIQRRYGLQKPIWINETNASPNLDPLWPVERPNFQVDLDQQAWFIVQAHALAFGADSTSVGIYKLMDVLLPEGGESFGILRPDSSRRPAFYAYQTVVRYLRDFTFPVGRQRAENFYAFTFNRPDSVTRILWSRNSADLVLKVPALADEALIVSATGDTERVVKAYRGHYRIHLRGARCTPECDIGGAPVFLVEAVDKPVDIDSMAAIDPETAIVATATPSPTPSPTSANTEIGAASTETPDAEPTATLTPEPTATVTALPTVTATSSPTSPPPTAVPSPTPASVSGEGEELAALSTDSAAQTTGDAGDGSPMDPPSGEGSASWWFIGAAVFLGSLLSLVVVRQRRN